MYRLLAIFTLFLVCSACTLNPPDSNQSESIATGMLKTRDYIITMYASGQDTYYSVRSLDGEIISEDITIETMVARFPELKYLQDNDNISWAGLDGEQINIEDYRNDF